MRRALPVLILLGLALGAVESEKLQQINQRIAEVNQRLDNLKKDRSSLVDEISKIELECERAKIEVNRIDLLARDARGRLQAKEAEEAGLQEQIARSRENLRRVVRVLYKSGGVGYLRFIFSMQDFGQFFRNYRYFSILINAKGDEIAAIRGNLARLETVRREIQQQLEATERLKQEKNGKLADMVRLKQEKTAFMDSILRERRFQMQLLDELESKAEELTHLVERQQQETVAVAPLLNTAEVRGRLPWPVRGTVVSKFGRQKSTRFNTYVINNGIEIRPGRSDEVRAVYDGEVVYADYQIGYGNLLILQHSRNFHTLYGHCEKFFKQKGDKVRRGEVIALVGTTGPQARKSLYFEIRENLMAQDPLPWLGKR